MAKRGLWRAAALAGALSLLAAGCGGKSSTGSDAGVDSGSGGGGGGGNKDAGGNGCATACSGATPICDTGSGECVQCLQNTQCPNDKPICTSAHACVAVSGNAESCAQALALTVSPGESTSFVADTTNAADDVTVTCSASSAPNADLVYQLTLTTAQDVTVKATAQTGTTADPVVALRQAPCDTGTELSCADTAGDTDLVEVRNLQPGDYFIVIETYGAYKGPMDVTVTLGGPTIPPEGDVCDAALPVTFTGNAAAFSVDTSTMADDYHGTCNATPSSAEAVYAVTLDQAQDVTVTATGAGAVQPVLFVHSSPCGPATQDEIACAIGATGTATFSARNVPAGTYFLFVESDGEGPAGVIDVNITLAPPTPPPAGDTCAMPEVLTVAPGASTSFQADTTNAANDLQGSCNTGTAPGANQDLVYKLTLTTAQDIAVEAVSNTGLDPDLYLRQGACDTGTEVVCAGGGGSTESLHLFNQPPGDYYLVIETYGANPGVVDVTVTLSGPTPPPANDTCASPQLLPVVPGTPVSTTLSTTTAANDESGSCNGNSATGGNGEVVYQVTLAAAQDLTVRAVPVPGSNADPVVYVRSATCAGGAEVACEDTTGGGRPEQLTLRNLPAGDYFVFVETYALSAGDLVLMVSADPPTPPTSNDTCATAQPITSFPAVIHADTSDATDDFQSCSNNYAGKDLVYTFTTTGTHTLTAKVTPTATPFNVPQLMPVVYLQDATNCGAVNTAGMQGCASATGAGGAAELVVPNLAAGTYFLVVDGGRFDGPFKLDVQLDAFTPVSGNDACAGAAPVALTNGAGSAVGTTLGAANDTTNTACFAAESAGPDVFFKFTTPALGANQTSLNTRVVAETLNGQIYNPLVNLRASCATTTAQDQLVCDATAAEPWAAGGLFSGASPSTDYYVVVDSGSTAAAGPFHLDVEVAPSPAPNDTCAGAQAITANTSVAGTTLGAANDYDYNNTPYYDGTAACDDLMDGTDVVYAFTATASGPATVSVQPAAGYDVALGVLSACAPQSCIATEDSVYEGDPESITFVATAGTTYYFVVDGYYDDANTTLFARGGFTLSVSQ